jgi:HlyD family secretion protein
MNSIASIFTKDVLRHPLVLLSALAVALIALGSGIYYAIETTSPSAQWTTPTMGAITQLVTGTGTVEPAQNPDLAFQSGGKVASVNVSVGQKVAQGQVLATLDGSALYAQRAQAQANLKAQQAKLSQLQAGPRSVDVAAKQTVVDQANTALANLYSSIPANIAQAYDKSFSGIGASTDTLFGQPNSSTPTLSFQTTNTQTAIDAGNQRALVNAELAQWKTEESALAGAPAGGSSSQIDAALTASLQHLAVLRTYCDTLLEALNSAIATSNFSAAQIAASQSAVGSLRDTINTQVLALQALEQNITTDKLSLRSSQDALNQTNAGSTPQDIAAGEAEVEAAQADVSNYDAQIASGMIVAPYAGTVTSVALKSGQIVAPNTVAVSLTPESALEVDVYLSELDVAKLAIGDSALVTLDAYGDARVFPARVVTIDRSPTQQNGVPTYKTTLQFATDDTAISSGMTANVTVNAAQKASALIIPKTAVILNGTSAFVLVPGKNGPVEQPVTLGLESTSTVEVTAGLSLQDQFLLSTK